MGNICSLIYDSFFACFDNEHRRRIELLEIELENHAERLTNFIERQTINCCLSSIIPLI